MELNTLKLFENKYVDGHLILADEDEANQCMKVNVIRTPNFKIGFGDRLSHDHEYDIYIPCYVYIHQNGLVQVHKLFKDGADIINEHKFDFVSKSEWEASNHRTRNTRQMLPIGCRLNRDWNLDITEFSSTIVKFTRPNYLRSCQLAHNPKPSGTRRPNLLGTILDMYLRLSQTFIPMPESNLHELVQGTDINKVIVDEIYSLNRSNWLGIFNRIMIMNQVILSQLRIGISRSVPIPIYPDDVPWE